MKLMVLVNTREEGEEEQAETKLMSTCVDVNWINCAWKCPQVVVNDIQLTVVDKDKVIICLSGVVGRKRHEYI